MSKLAEMINAPSVFKIAGQELKAKPLSIGVIYDCIQTGLRSLDPDLTGMELQDKAQECLENGNFPRVSVEHIVFNAMKDMNDGFDMDDARAVCGLSHFEEALKVAEFALGANEKADGPEGNPPTADAAL